MPTKFKLYSMGIESKKNKLKNAPKRGEFWNIPNVINVPNADGSIEEYRV
jgi:hypothetical protein